LNFDSEFKGVDLYWNAYILVFNQNGANAKQHLGKKLQVSKEHIEFLKVSLGIQILPGLWGYRISVLGSEGPRFESPSSKLLNRSVQRKIPLLIKMTVFSVSMSF
jgi:hypothetical protein